MADSQRFDDLSLKIDTVFGTVMDKLSKIDARLDGMDRRISNVESKLDMLLEVVDAEGMLANVKTVAATSRKPNGTAK